MCINHTEASKFYILHNYIATYNSTAIATIDIDIVQIDVQSNTAER